MPEFKTGEIGKEQAQIAEIQQIMRGAMEQASSEQEAEEIIEAALKEKGVPYENISIQRNPGNLDGHYDWNAFATIQGIADIIEASYKS